MLERWSISHTTLRTQDDAVRDILRMLDVEFGAVARMPEPLYYPAELATEMDALMDDIYARVNNGVYACGFATSQEAYDRAFADLAGFHCTFTARGLGLYGHHGDGVWELIEDFSLAAPGEPPCT